MVVLAVRQPPHRDLGGLARGRPGIGRLRGEPRQLPNPVEQQRLFVAARRDELAARVFLALGRLGEKRRSFGMAAIHQPGEAASERLDLAFGRLRLWKVQPRSRRDAAVDVAGSTVRLLQDGVEPVGKLAVGRRAEAGGRQRYQYKREAL